VFRRGCYDFLKYPSRFGDNLFYHKGAQAWKRQLLGFGWVWQWLWFGHLVRLTPSCLVGESSLVQPAVMAAIAQQTVFNYNV
jgi:hypothetical protein